MNIVLGIRTAILMMGGDFLNSLSEAQGQDNLSVFDAFYLTYILHPATGVLYTAMYTGLAVYQFTITSL